MKVAVYSTHQFEQEYLQKANGGRHELIIINERLTEDTVALAAGCEAACIFTSDVAKGPALVALQQAGVRFLSLRSAGYNHVDLNLAKELNMKVARVPAYSPYAIAEHAVALMMALNRKLIEAHQRVMNFNFSLDGLVGFDMNKKTVGIIGTGHIGAIVARIMHGFGCKILAFDISQNELLSNMYGLKYTDLTELCAQSDIITLHLPLNESTRYLIDRERIQAMKPGVMLINTGRGALLDTKAAIEGLKAKQIGALGMDVYEHEEGLFFDDHSHEILQDDMLARLMAFKNVIITGHQAFLTETALINIADTTIHNLNCFEKGIACENEVTN